MPRMARKADIQAQLEAVNAHVPAVYIGYTAKIFMAQALAWVLEPDTHASPIEYLRGLDAQRAYREADKGEVRQVSASTGSDPSATDG